MPRFACLTLMLATLSVPLIEPVFAQEPAAPRTALKVCAPPYNLPMSDKDGSGYENRIAKLFAQELGLPLETTWFPQRMGFIRATLKNNETADGSYKCDLVMGVVDNFELAATTVPYMRSSWAMVYVKGRGLDWVTSQADLANLDDAKKKLLRIGVWDQGPTTELVYHLGLFEHATPYPIMSGDARQGPGHVIENDLVADKVNLTFAWGPIAGYLAKKIKDHELVVIPLQNERGLKFDYQISMAVRHPDKAWKAEVNGLITRNRGKIDAILDEYGVPRLPLLATTAGEDDDDD